MSAGTAYPQRTRRTIAEVPAAPTAHQGRVRILVEPDRDRKSVPAAVRQLLDRLVGSGGPVLITERLGCLPRQAPQAAGARRRRWKRKERGVLPCVSPNGDVHASRRSA
ncbi:hypothetical protein GCM10027074_31100 [Streptomyces deserti]